MTPVGLRFPSNMSWSTWENTGRQLARFADSSMWCLGDWVAYGLDRYTDRYRAAIEAVGLDYQTLRNYVWVARRFARSRRRAGLSFQHHAEVAALPAEDQDRWLDRATENQWSRSQLRQRLQDSRAGRSGGGRTSGSVVPRLHIASERAAVWRRAADTSGEEFVNWMIRSLDEAARRTLRRD